MTTYAVVTFGCRVNQADSLGFEEELLRTGARPGSVETADVIIVNTCSVTAAAEQGARQTLRRVARTNPSARIVVTGCYATRDASSVAALPRVADVVPNERKLDLVRGINLAPESLTHATPSAVGDGPCGTVIEPGVAGRTAFTLRVQTGCAEPCSYCIIPATRGTPHSARSEDLLHEIERVVEAGFKEIALTGVHLGSYGRDLSPASSLTALLKAIAAQWNGSGVLFRISSLEPMDCTPDIVSLMSAEGCFAPHFHLPLQHASDRVLARMRRPYTHQQYSDLVTEIRRRLPLASIGSDVIVGFPGETSSDFEELAGYLEASPLTHVHVFPYSDRPGTVASALPEKVSGQTTRERGQRIRAIAAALTARFRQSQIGAVHRALTLDDGTVAVTGNYLKVRIPAGRPRNEWVNVRITHVDPDLVGSVV